MNGAAMSGDLWFVGDDLAGFVSYDRRLLAAAERLGLRTLSPGVT